MFGVSSATAIRGFIKLLEEGKIEKIRVGKLWNSELFKEGKMNSLYIIGNGFDIAHGIDSSYWSFRVFLEKNHYEFLQRFESMYNIYQLDESEYGYSEETKKRWESAVNKDLWSEFERLMATPNIQSMLDYSTSIIDVLNRDSGNIGIRDTMDTYWMQEFGFIKNLQQYVKEWIEQLDISEVHPRKQELVDNNSDFFFNFNYTRVLEDVYCVDRVLHIHGTIGSGANYDPIMGHCDSTEIEKRKHFSHEADEILNEGESSIQEAIADYLNAIYKDTKIHMDVNESFFECLDTVTSIIIIGWSAGEVDIPYLLKIKGSVSKDARWIAYYYNEDARISLKRALADCNILDDIVDFREAHTFWDI